MTLLMFSSHVPEQRDSATRQPLFTIGTPVRKTTTAPMLRVTTAVKY